MTNKEAAKILEKRLERVKKDLLKKFKKGREAHVGENLEDLNYYDELRQEVLDMIIYLELMKIFKK